MRGLVRSLVFAATLAFGSWVGLHRAPPATASVDPTTAKSDAPPAGTDATPLPPPSDPSISDLPPWPHLNPTANISKAWQLAQGPHREPGDKRKLVTLTFDDGPFPETTPKVLELLEHYNVHATFFVIGRYLDGEGERARASRAVLKNMVGAGHLVGNHTHDHALLTAVSHTQVLEQLDRGSASIERVTGKKPVLLRPPFGELDDFGQQAVQARGLDVLLWSAEVQDMERDDTQTMFRELVRQLHANQGGIVLLHDIRWTSINILKRLLAYLDAKRYDPTKPTQEGYEIVDLPAYLRAVAASPPQPGRRDGRPSPPPQPSKKTGPVSRVSPARGGVT